MATHEIDYPDTGLTLQAHATELAYDKTQANGHVLAGKDIAVEISANGTVRPVRDGNAVAGKLILVMEDQRCLVRMEGKLLGFLQGAANGCALGEGIVGATGPSIGGQTNGYVKSPAYTTDTDAGRKERALRRGLITSIDSNTAGGTVRVSL